MVKFPLVIIYAVVAFNITAFATLLQMNILIIQSPIAKVLAWTLTIGAWAIAYINRNKSYTLRLF
jgi:hypothetical protein